MCAVVAYPPVAAALVKAGVVVTGLLTGAVLGQVVADVVISSRNAKCEKERCREVKNQCIEECLDQLGKGDHGAAFYRCLANCMRRAGCYP